MKGWGLALPSLRLAWLLACSHQHWSLLPVAEARVPQDLSNFQNEFLCKQETLIVRPRTVADIQAAVAMHTHVQANGAGMSWNQPFFCANPNVTDPTIKAQSSVGDGAAPTPTSANIQLSTVRPLTIRVHEQEEAVEVDAGVVVWDLIDYLAHYVTPTAPAGWTLPAFPWYVFQTIGGAASTGTHGSSLTWGTLSSQVLSLTMVAANGSLITLTPQSHPLLMRAARISVGRLGIITSLKLRIVREQPVKRELRTLPASAFLEALRVGQVQYRANKTLPAWMNETEWFWLSQTSEFMMVSFTRGDVDDGATRADVLSSYKPDTTTVYDTSAAARLSYLSSEHLKPGTTFDPPLNLTPAAQTYTREVLADRVNAPPKYTLSPQQAAAEAAGTRVVAAGDTWKAPQPKSPSLMYALPAAATGMLEVSRMGLLSIANNATIEASRAYLSQPPEMLQNIENVQYDQYEVAFPVSSMADCIEGMLRVAYGDDTDSKDPAKKAKDKGLRSAALLRLIRKEDALLSLTDGEPVMFINIEDYLYYNGGRRKHNEMFRAIMAHFRSNPACGRVNPTHPNKLAKGARLHWGKAGWPDRGCWRGDEEFGDKWCSFGCAVRELDPTSKFADSAPDRWTWEGVDLAQCCGAEGFKAGPGCECKVAHARPADDCPPPPFYTTR